MIRNKLLIIGIIIVFHFFDAKAYVPMVREGVEWGHKATSISWIGDGDAYFYKERLSGDFEVDGNSYKKCYRYSTTDFDTNQATVIALMREENKKVYIRKTDFSYMQDDCELDNSLIEDSEVVAYDFTLAVGEKFTPLDGMSYVLESIEMVTVDGNERIMQVFDKGMKVLEGVGIVEGYDFDFGLPYQTQPTGTRYWEKAITYERIIGGDVVYKTTSYDASDPALGGAGREAVIAASEAVRAFGAFGAAVIEGDGCRYTIYAADGRMVAAGTANGRTEVALPRGIYIVDTASGAHRIAVR